MLAVLGGLVTVVAGAQDILSLVGRGNLPRIEAITETIIYGVLVIALGLVGVWGARKVKSLGWDVVLIIAGLFAYQFDGGFPWLFGPILVVLAGVVGIVARLS
jgi:hypothetical protein